MSTFVLHAPDRFPIGTVVGAYPSVSAAFQGAPPGPVAATATVQSDSSLTFTGLRNDHDYVAYASVGGRDVYVNFHVQDQLIANPQFGVMSDGNVPAWSATDKRFVPTAPGTAVTDSSGHGTFDWSVTKEAPINPMYAEYAGGAKCDGATDDTAAWAAAIAAAATAPVGVNPNDTPQREIIHPGGASIVKSPGFALPPNLRIAGVGAQSAYFVCRGATPFHVFTLAGDASGVGIELAHFGIKCDSFGGGIDFSNQNFGLGSITGDTLHRFEDLVIMDATAAQHGLAFAGTQCVVRGVYVGRPAGLGVDIGGSDHDIAGLTQGSGTGANGSDTFRINASNLIQATGVKVFGGTGNAVISGQRCQFGSVQFQDLPPGAVISVNGFYSSIDDLLIDSCDSGLHLNSGAVKVRGVIQAQRGGAANQVQIALFISGTEADVDLLVIGPLGNRLLGSVASMLGNRVKINNMGGAIAFTPGVALVPQPTVATTWIANAPLAADQAISNATSEVSANGTGDFFYDQELEFSLPSDATPRQITFGTDYKLVGGGFTWTPGASTTGRIAFAWDGAHWGESWRSVV